MRGKGRIVTDLVLWSLRGERDQKSSEFGCKSIDDNISNSYRQESE